MDPLSAIASTIAIATVAAESVQKLRRVCGARQELEDLASCITRWSIVLKEVRKAFDFSQEYMHSQGDAILSLVQSAESRLNSIDGLYELCLEGSQALWNTPKIKRLRWLTLQGKVKKYLEELENDHQSLQTIISTIIVQRLEVQQNSITELENKLSNIETLLITPTTSTRDISQSENAVDPDALQLLVLAENDLHVWEVTVDTAPQANSWCTHACSCFCHASFHLRSPQFLASFLGSFRLKLPRNLSGRFVCNQRTCKSKNRAPWQISYFFPTWILTRAIISQIQTDPLTEQKFGLKIIAIVHDDADVFQIVKKGDVSSLIPIFQNRLASPNVVNHSWHVPLLSYAVQGNHVEMCKFLLDAGADPILENRSNICPLDRAWDAFLMKSISSETALAFQGMFSLYSNSPWIEEQQFSITHKMVLGMAGQQLHSQLELCTADEIDKQDSKGRSALSWAAIRGDVKALEELLKYEADANVRSITNNTPLMFASQAASPACIAPLLKCGADVNLQNSQRFSALHYAAYYKNDPAYLEPLIQAGADVEARDKYGWSPLMSAVEYDNLESATTLLKHDANIEHRDTDGLTPLHHSIRSNSYRVLAAFLSRGANQRATSRNGETVLHFAAQSGNARTLDILSAMLSQKLEIDARDSHMLTAADLMDRRVDSIPSLKAQFQHLIQKCQMLEQPHVRLGEEQRLQVGEGLDTSDTFHDALEVQSN